MNLDATTIAHYQACRRRHVLERTWRPPQWRPKTLWERELLQGILALSSGVGLSEVIRVRRAAFFGQAANPGLDLPPGTNSFIVAKDWAMMLEMVLRTLKRSPLLELKTFPAVDLDDGLVWRVISSVDGSGVLHRWIACDRWDQDDLSRQVHSWHTFGDLAVTRRPLTLHVIETGQVRAGRRDSCWTRGFRSRYAPNLPLKFKRPERNQQDMIAEYLADKRSEEEGIEGWVTEIIRSGLAAKHIHHIPLECPPDEVCESTLAQIRAIAAEIKVSAISEAKWNAVAMARSACDGLVPCPWQDVCYRHPLVDPEDAGYVRLDAVSSSVRPEPGATVQVVSQSRSL